MIIGMAVIILMIHLIKGHLINRMSDKHHRFMARKIVGGIGYWILLLWVMFTLTSNQSNVAVAFGVVGAGIAFALQEVIASFAGWLVIMFWDFYKAWDRVQLWGIKGDIVEIGVLRTTLMEIGEWVNGDQYNGRLVRVANSFVFKEPVYNYSSDAPFLRDELTIVVKYWSDYNELKTLLSQIAKKTTGEYITKYKSAWEQMVNAYIIDESNIEPHILTQMMPYWVECTLRYIAPYNERRITKDKLYTHILDEICSHPSIMLMASTSTSINVTTNAANSTASN